MPLIPTPSPTPSPTVAPQSVSGSVIAIPQGAYGPNATSTGILANATVVIGSTPVLGATAPPAAPAGDIIVATSSSGTFTATPLVGPAAQTSPVTVLSPGTTATRPALGYYVSIFAPGTDGKSAGVSVPLHTFVAVGSGLTFRVTTTSNDEAAFLAKVNSDRASQAGLTTPLIFDELSVEAARQHVAEMQNTAMSTLAPFMCHYNPQNVGPLTRFALLGALGSSQENINGFAHAAQNANSTPQTEPTATQIWQGAEAAWVGEKATNGPHWAALSRVNAAWVGLAVGTNSTLSGTNYIYQGVADLEIVAPGDNSAFYNYPNTGCPAGITANNS